MAKKKKGSEQPKIETVRHKDKRKNIPTEELRDFVADEENQPRKILYPRDPSLDPQLVWKGKVQMIYLDPPETGKIAVKVINHYGDEVLRVYEVK